MASRLPVIMALTGPTAVGKTDVALALAQRLPLDIISMDSAMVYRGLDIGSAKPSLEILQQFPHALVNIRDPAQPYSAADFVADADAAVAASLAAGRLPLLVGGTMLYLKAFREGLAPLPAADADVRARLREQAEETGWPALHERLRELDPVAAAGIHPNNAARIERALEVCLLTGQPMSALWSQAGSEPVQQRLRARLEEVAIQPDNRAALHERIDARTTRMLEEGLIGEVERLHQRADLHQDLPSIRAVGYRQTWSFLNGDLAQEELAEKIAAATRQLAKRQLTWLRGWRLRSVTWGDPEALAKELVAMAAP
jgi:tRNA dimethylallyltransferase